MNLPSYRIMAFLLSDPGAEIPWEWRDHMQPLIYSFIDDGGKVHSARYSLFSFALTPLDPVSGRDGAASGNGAWAFRFSSALISVLEQVAASLRKSRELKIAGTAFRVSAVVAEALSDRAVYQTASPVLAAKLAFWDGGKPFWNPAEPGFAAAVAKSLLNRWAFLTGEEPPCGGVGFSFLSPPKQRMIQYRGRDLPAFSGTVRLDAPREMRLFAQCVGLGQKPSCGFGLLV